MESNKDVKDTRGNKRELILEEALKLLFQRGFEETHVSDIAEAAGIGKSTVYEYFPSKEAIYLELYQAHVTDRYATLPGLLKEAGPAAADKLRCFLQFDIATIKLFAGNTQPVSSLLPKPGQFRDPRLEEALRDLMILRFSTVHDIIRDGMDAGEFTPADPILATVSIMGSLSFFETLLCGLIPPEYSSLLPTSPAAWSTEDFFRFLCAGLSA